MKTCNFFRWIFKKNTKIKPSSEELEILHNLNNKLIEVENTLDDLQYARSQNFFWSPTDEKIYNEKWDFRDDLVSLINVHKQYLWDTYKYR